ncbi:hypothetical protein ACFSCX_06055 [Bacillus salitolerans]|uniref:Uncharacterized protein n=1 Tax=Bacillus salitolerans TaxID=1437434 RepID=A0ABW4LLR9_9BACI
MAGVSRQPFSRYNLIAEEYQLLAEQTTVKQGFISRLLESFELKKELEFVVKVPTHIYMDVKILIEDVSEISEYDLGKVSHADLIFFIFQDFILDIRHLDNRWDDIFRRIADAMQHVESKKNQHDTRKRSDKHHMITVYIPRPLVLRTEVLLRNLSRYKRHEYTVETLLEVVFLDFMYNYLKGDVQDGMKKFLQYLEE